MANKQNYSFALSDELIAVVNDLAELDGKKSRSQWVEDALWSHIGTIPKEQLEEQLKREIDDRLMKLDRIKSLRTASA